jgi:hypothetical protein
VCPGPGKIGSGGTSTCDCGARLLSLLKRKGVNAEFQKTGTGHYGNLYRFYLRVTNMDRTSACRTSAIQTTSAVKPDVRNLRQLINALKTRGKKVRRKGRVEQPFLSVKGQIRLPTQAEIRQPSLNYRSTIREASSRIGGSLRNKTTNL